MTRRTHRSTSRPHPEAGDRGAATTLSLVLLTPMMLVLGLAAFQAALWSHARTEVRVVARDTAALVARSGADPASASASASAMLERDAVVRDVVVSTEVVDDLVRVAVRGRAPGIVRGTSVPIEIVAAVPLEGWVR